jgi:hypothetical protein
MPIIVRLSIKLISSYLVIAPCGWHRVVSAGAKRVATQNAPQGIQTAFDNTVTGNGLYRISGAGWIKTTGSGQER